jgi:hypothetical protein
MMVELIGGPLDGETREVKNPNVPLRIAMRRRFVWQHISLIPSAAPKLAEAEYVPRPDSFGVLYWAGSSE